MKYAIIGGTGTLGNCLVEKLTGKGHIVVFSRDELKQQEMRKRFPEASYVIGDIRDAASLPSVLKGVDVVFLVAALKHVDVLEANPTEAIKTNILGTINVAEACLAAKVKHVVFSSTDKAVLPINVYGMTKGIAERYLIGLNVRQTATKFSVFRWGNVLGSRGSVVHTFADSLKQTGGVRITDPAMSRFWIHIEDAVDFMLENYKEANRFSVMIPPMKAAPVIQLADSMARVLGMKHYEQKFVGIRAGEKIHECLESNHDYCLRSDTVEQYTSDELCEMVKRVMAC